MERRGELEDALADIGIELSLMQGVRRGAKSCAGEEQEDPREAERAITGERGASGQTGVSGVLRPVFEAVQEIQGMLDIVRT